MKVPRREVQLQFLLTFCLDENYNCSEIRYFLRKKNNTNRKIRTYQLQLVLDCIEYNVKIQQNYAQKSKHVYIYLCCIYLSILGSFKNDFWQKKNLTTILLIVDSALKFSLNRAISWHLFIFSLLIITIPKGKNH